MNTADSERWLVVIGYEGRYSVSSLGRVKNEVSGYVLKPQVKVNGGVGRKRYRGYMGVRLCGDGGVIKNHRIASLVAAAFLGPTPVGAQINHIDGDKANNSAANLEYTTPKENRQHASRIGLNRASTGTERDVAARYGINWSTVNSIRNRHTWRHLL